jgi:streptogramin lyase
MRICAGAISVLCSTVVLVSILGCGGKSSSTTTPPPPPPTFEISGTVMGGQQAVDGAEVQLFVAGSSGYGAGATPLASSGSTDSTGKFTIEGNVTCPTSGALTYLTASGGHTGTGSDNAAIGMMAALGTCGSLSSSTAITVNEVTTVAAVWALAPFLKSGGILGTSSGNAQGLANAFANVNNLVDLSIGATPGKGAPANATIPTTKIDTLADILAACVSQSTSSACSTLFTAATPAGGSAPANTLDAALAIARNPAANIAALFALASTSAPYQPVLTAMPPDWTLAVSYSGGGLNTPGSLALDASGNVWVADYFGSVTELSMSGQPISPAGGFTGGGLTESYGLAVNTDGSVWVTDEQSSGVNGGDGSVTVLNSSGQPVSGTSGYFGGGVFFPIAAAADTDGSVWIADYGDSTATRLGMDGTPISGSTGFGSSQLEGPVAVAIDATHTAWFANQAAQSGSVTSISADGTKVNTFACGGDAPSGIATDAVADVPNAAAGHIWTANYYSDSVSELALHSDGSVTVVGSPSTGGGILHPNGIAVDGAGNVWVANYRGASISELQGASSASPGTPFSPSAGFGSDASLSAPFGVAVDASGNVWVSNQGSSTITQFLGAAAPVKTPLLGPPQLP